jgi:hypothetical protein
MKRCETIAEIMEYILRKHRNLKSPNGGFYGYKLLRKTDGKRIPFEEVDGFRIFNYDITGNDLRLDQMSSGFEFRGRRKIQQTAKLWLTDLVLVNVYDHSAEFFSQASIDFIYVEKSKESEIELLSEWVRNVTPVIRRQWMRQDDDIDRILDSLSIGRRLITVNQPPRMIDMEDDF